MEYIITFLDKNGLVFAFLVTGAIMYFSEGLSKALTRNKIPGSAISIFMGLVLAYFAGLETLGKKGIADAGKFPGIGAQTATALLKHFRSVKNLEQASLEEIAKVAGNSKAKKLLAYFKQSP